MCEQRGTEGQREGDHHALHVVPRLSSRVLETLAPAAQQLPSLQVSLCHSNRPLLFQHWGDSWLARSRLREPRAPLPGVY